MKVKSNYVRPGSKARFPTTRRVKQTTSRHIVRKTRPPMPFDLFLEERRVQGSLL